MVQNVIFCNFRGSEFLFLVNLSNFQVPNLPNIQSSESLKLPRMTFLDHLNLTKLGFTENLTGGKIIKCQQSQTLTSHFESFWTIVDLALFESIFWVLFI